MDILDARERSCNMSRIRGRDTAPELAVRRIAHKSGFRYRLYRKDLPGRPDLVFPRHGLALFVHGCFWHRHKKCRYAYTPKTNVGFWTEKFEKNVARDKRSYEGLRRLGWQVLVIWECETLDDSAVEMRLNKELRHPGKGIRSINSLRHKVMKHRRRSPANTLKLDSPYRTEKRFLGGSES